MDEEPTALSELLRVALRRANVPQREAGDVLGMSQTALADKLNGRRPLRPREAMVVAQLSNIDCTAIAPTVREIDHLEAQIAILRTLVDAQLRDVICALETAEPVPA
jgi:DNA-binding transcriptional regulator YdaS (Cro superfamily)